MTKSKTVMFFPFSHGVGFGYIGRELYIAQQLTEAGIRCVFGSDTTEGLVARCGFEVQASPGRHGVSVPDMRESRGQYIPLDNLDTVFGMIRYYHVARIREHVDADLAAIDAVSPDVVVVDMQVSAAIAARARGIPVVSVADSDFIRDDDNSWMPWLPPEQANVLPYPTCVPAFNELLSDFGQPPIDHVSDLLWGDLTLLASTPGLESQHPPLRVRGELRYVGPVYWDPPWSTVDTLLDSFGNDAKLRIYATLGHGGKVQADDFQKVVDGCNHPDWALFTSLGFRAPEKAITLPENTRCGGFTGIRAPINWCDVVISHGGYSTVLASLEYGKPSIVIPYMSEQEGNGILFVEKPGAGFVLRKTVPVKAADRHFDFILRYSGRNSNSTFSALEIRRAVEEITAHQEFAAQARATSLEIRETIARRDFVDLIRSVY